MRSEDSRTSRKCPKDCRYRSRLAPFCGFCMMKILGKREEESDMQMMIDNSEQDKATQEENPRIIVSDPKELKQLVNAIPDGVVLSVDMEEVIFDYGQNTKR